MDIKKSTKEEIFKEIEQKMNARRLHYVCTICSSNDFQISGFFHDFIQDDIKDTNLGGSQIPTFSLICNNCGHKIDFALAKWIDISKYKEIDSNATKK